MHAIGFGMGLDRLQPCDLFAAGRDDQLAGIAMRDVALAAIGIQRLLARDAQPRHQAAGGIVDSGVDYLAVARRGHGADRVARLQHDHFAAGQSEAPGDGQPDHAGADYDAFNPVHVPSGHALGIARTVLTHRHQAVFLEMH